MKKTLFLIIGLLLYSNVYGAVPIIFTNGTVADATEVNQNFDYFEIKFSTTGGHDHDATDSKTITVLGTITTGTWQGTIIDEAYGGTGINSYTTGDLIQATADTVLGKISPGAAGTFLQSQGASTEVAYSKVDLADTNDVTGTLPEANGGTGATSGVILDGDAAGGDLTGTYPNPGAKASNVIFAWSGNEIYGANEYGMNISTTQNLDISVTDSAGYINFVNDDTTYRTFLNFKFKKPIGVDTVTIYARLWSSNVGNTATLSVDIGGQSNTVARAGETTPGWTTAGTIDISSLTDGTVYDGIIQLKDSQTANDSYCSAVTLIGS